MFYCRITVPTHLDSYNAVTSVTIQHNTTARHIFYTKIKLLPSTAKIITVKNTTKKTRRLPNKTDKKNDVEEFPNFKWCEKMLTLNSVP